MNIIRTDAEIDQVLDAARKAAFAAEDAGDVNDHAEGVYSVLLWLTGNSDTSPVDGYDDEED